MYQFSKFHISSWLAFGLLAIIVAPFAGAAMIPQSTHDLAERSTEIIAGVVESVKSQWDDNHEFIFTRVTVRVTESFKGKAPVASTVTVVVLGGEVDGVGLGVEHAAQFKLSEEIILFLRPIQGTDFTVTAWEQGKYTLENGQVKEKNVPVAQFKQEIRDAAKQ